MMQPPGSLDDVKALRQRMEQMEANIRGHGEVLRRLDEEYKTRPKAPTTASEAAPVAATSAGGIVRGRWCITALVNITSLPGNQGEWDGKFDSAGTDVAYAACPTCYGELPLSFWFRWATRHVLLMESSESVSATYIVAMTGAAGDAILKLNGKITSLSPPYTSVDLDIRAGTNRLVIISKGNVELYGFGQILGGPVRFSDKGCGRFTGEEGAEDPGAPGFGRTQNLLK